MLVRPKSSTTTLKKLLDKLDREEIRVDTKYQRSGKVWPSHAKSFLVETVLRGMPIPHVLLHRPDTTRPPHLADIIDGQQRCTILQDFRRGGFVLTASVDDPKLVGKGYADLPKRLRDSFDQYEVMIDEYEGVSHGQIRHVFRRLNYYTAPLNAAEQRHAQFFGELSRFIEEQARFWRPLLERFRVLTPMQLRRRADEQLMAEIVDAMLNGISTTTAKSLRAIYRRHERRFSSGPDFDRRLKEAHSRIEKWEWLRRSRLRRQYQIFSLIMVVMHSQRGLKALRAHLGERMPLCSDDKVKEALKPLDKAVRTRALVGPYAGFWAASHEKTNVHVNRLRRCKYFYRALTG